MKKKLYKVHEINFQNISHATSAIIVSEPQIDERQGRMQRDQKIGLPQVYRVF